MLPLLLGEVYWTVFSPGWRICKYTTQSVTGQNNASSRYSFKMHQTYLPTYTYLPHTGIHPPIYLTTHFPPYQPLHLPKTYKHKLTYQPYMLLTHKFTHPLTDPANQQSSTPLLCSGANCVGTSAAPPKKKSPNFLYCFID